jgi:hypothetical protein
MSHFSGLGETELFEKGVYLTAGGNYELEIVKILLKETRRSGLGFIVEFKVIEASGEGGAQHAPGTKATWFQKMTDKDIAFPAIKQFFVALLDIDMNDPEAKEQFDNQVEEIVEEATEWTPENPDDTHPLAGERIQCETYTKVTKKGVDFTVHNWGVAA